jgi:thiamine biosynthesis lipoprotein
MNATQPNPDRPFRWHYHDAMACTWGLYLPADDQPYARQAAAAAFAELDRLEAVLSRFRPDSDISQLNRAAAGQTIPVGPETRECLELAHHVQRATDGTFDITYASTGSAADSPGAGRWQITADRRAVAILADGVQFDLGGIGKGYALDQLRVLLAEWDFDCGLLHGGQSTVLALGGADEPWRLPLRHPTNPDDTLGTVELCDQALSGSGAILHGEHIHDPRRDTRPCHALATWAVAPQAALADALSTALFVLEWAPVPAVCDAFAAGAGMLIADEPTTDRTGPELRTTPGFPLGSRT